MTSSPYTMHLVLFFTKGVSLQTWDAIGSLSREIAPYLRFTEEGMRVSFVTYGGRNDLGIGERFPAIRVCCNRWGLPRPLYERLIPTLHGEVLRTCTVVKTNQTSGADAALRAARRWNVPLIARCGYMLSFSHEQHSGADSWLARRARALESRIFAAAQRVVVTTEAMAVDVRRRVPQAAGRIRVIPNSVDVDLFTPPGTAAVDYDVIFVGRLSREKNATSLLRAISGMDVRALVVGSGTECPALQRSIANARCRVEWRERVPHAELAGLVRRARVFVQPSFYEGHPKTIIEAMACARPVIGANVPGIRDILRHGETGWLCGTDSDSIRRAIETLLADPALRERLGAAARTYAVEHFALDRIVRTELTLIRELHYLCDTH